jgi:hypothetical protein
MMTGIPVVSIGPEWMRIFPYGPQMFEGHELVGWSASPDSDQVISTRGLLSDALKFEESAANHSRVMRERAIDLFGIDTVADQWAAYLGVKVPA